MLAKHNRRGLLSIDFTCSEGLMKAHRERSVATGLMMIYGTYRKDCFAPLWLAIFHCKLLIIGIQHYVR